MGVDELSGVRHCGQSREGPVAARSSLLVRDATLLSDRQIQKIADEAKGVWTHAGLLAKLRVPFELAKGNLAAAIKKLESAPQSNHILSRTNRNQTG